jgi:hypothetical protein
MNLQDGPVVNWTGVGSSGDSRAPALDSQADAPALHTNGLTPVVGVVSEVGAYLPHALGLAAAAGYPVELVPGLSFHGLA